MLAFIDQIVIPFLEWLYGLLGYLGVMVAMAIESAMIPLPSELILPFAGFLVSDPTQIERFTNPDPFFSSELFPQVIHPAKALLDSLFDELFSFIGQV